MEDGGGGVEVGAVGCDVEGGRAGLAGGSGRVAARSKSSVESAGFIWIPLIFESLSHARQVTQGMAEF